MQILQWMKSTRSIIATVLSIGLTVGLFTGVITGDQFMQALMLVFGAYFAKRDGEQDRSTGS